MDPAMVFIVFLFGALVGSFLNVCIHRLPREESIVWPGSRCPTCGRSIAWYDNIPIVSYLLLAGKCRHCSSSISWQYPVVELANALGYVGLFWWFGLTWVAVAYAVFFSALLVITAIDFAHYIIPNVITLPGIGLGLVFAATFLPVGIVNALLGVLLGGGLLWFLAWISPYVFGKEGMGGGDIKLLAMVGAFLGWKPTLLTVMVGALVGSIVGIGLIAAKIIRRDHYLPFGPFLALGAIVALFFSQDLFDWYSGILNGVR